MKPILALLILAATPLRADPLCDDWWFTRNLVYNQNGYCFSTPLGQALFDNSDCIGTEVTLSATDQEIVAEARRMEEQFNCAVDTGATTLDIPNLPLWLRLEQSVVHEEFASGCLGWQGEDIPLYAGPREGAEQIATIRFGDDIVGEYKDIGAPPGWGFVTLYRGQDQIGLGWSNARLNHDLCSRTAG